MNTMGQGWSTFAETTLFAPPADQHQALRSRGNKSCGGHRGARLDCGGARDSGFSRPSEGPRDELFKHVRQYVSSAVRSSWAEVYDIMPSLIRVPSRGSSKSSSERAVQFQRRSIRMLAIRLSPRIETYRQIATFDVVQKSSSNLIGGQATPLP